jgi:hypothetical protein
MHTDPPPPASAVPVPEIPLDPNLAAEKQKADATLTTQLQAEAQGDTASLMARYGTRLALSGAGMSPMATP